MEYPGSHLTKPWRRALLITCFALFFIISPIIIMAAMGYRYDWQNGLLRETGSVSIDVKPTNVKVVMNDVLLKESVPIRLNNITPRKYIVKITAPGYYDWQKEIEVKNKQTAYIKEISLLKKNDPTKIINRTTDNLTISADGRYLAYFADRSVWLYDHNTKMEKRISTWTDAETPEIKWSKKGYLLAFGKNNSNTVVIFDVEKQKTWNISDPDNNKIAKFQWQNTAESELVFGTNEKIYVARPTTQKIIEMGSNNYLDWYAENGSLWTMQTGSTTAQTKIVRDTLGFATDIITIEPGINNINLTDGWYFYEAKGNTALLKNNNQEMLIVDNDKYYKINGSKALISDYNNWWLAWTPWELVSFSSGNEPVLLNRSGEQLKQVLPLDEYNTLALIWNDKVTVLFPYYNVSDTLINQAVVSGVADNKNKILYFSTNEKDKNGTWELEY